MKNPKKFISLKRKCTLVCLNFLWLIISTPSSYILISAKSYDLTLHDNFSLWSKKNMISEVKIR